MVFVLGSDETNEQKVAYKYTIVENAKQELENTKKYWNELLRKTVVKTPVESMNIILNGWAAYQTIASRLWARSGFYQSGGAYGFRDQLQDTMGIKYINPDFMKKQVLRHAAHQFIEGDVEHWWHEETMRGIRTRFSDDLLWLVFAVIEYIEFTGDRSILEIETNYIKGDELKEGEDERYDKYLPSETKETIYMHCIRAVNKALNFGENGLPKIGSGDWNDGFSEVGNKGKGESVWLGFFLYLILEHFGDVCQNAKNDIENYEQIKNELKKALNTKGWDGRWYRRAYMDSGDVLGSMENEECRIDGISQSWSVISGAGDNDKKYISMENVPEIERFAMVERHIISKNFASNYQNRAIIISDDERICIMLGEEDHIRIQVLLEGLQFEKAYEIAETIDSILCNALDIAYDNRIGFLTECPTNLGTGLRASAMLHLQNQ